MLGEMGLMNKASPRKSEEICWVHDGLGVANSLLPPLDLDFYFPKKIWNPFV